MTADSFPAARLPELVFDSEPGFVELYNVAWKLAWEHVLTRAGAPVSPYMDEGFDKERIWLWDTSFMVHFCKYAPEAFPGVASLENFYRPMLDGEPSTLLVHHPDNPPLPAWAEYANFRVTGDRQRLKKVLADHRWLQRYFDLFEAFKRGDRPAWGGEAVWLQREPLGYLWRGNPNGMDNTPRGGVSADESDSRNYETMYWFDALAQQALSARLIFEMAEAIGLGESAAKFRTLWFSYCNLLNSRYYDREDGFYYDIERTAPHRFIEVKTPAVYWAMLAGACTAEQAGKLALAAVDHNIFGGDFPFPSVSRNDSAYNPLGEYWRGGIWLPLSYMAIKALEKYGFTGIADQAAEKTVRLQLETYRNCTPHTIWECYSPSECKPATNKRAVGVDEPVRTDFCGWSALGPISLMIENVVGLDLDGAHGKAAWRIKHTGRHGVKNVTFGGIRADFLTQGSGTVEIDSDRPFTLTVNGRELDVRAGHNLLNY